MTGPLASRSVSRAVDRLPIGERIEVTYPGSVVDLMLRSETSLTFVVRDGPDARSETVGIEVTDLGDGVFVVSWQESDGATVTNIKDFGRSSIRTFVTTAAGAFVRMSGPMQILPSAAPPSDHCPVRNKALALEAMIALFQRRDPTAVDRLYAPDYVQHSPCMPQKLASLKALIADLPEDAWYEPELIVAERDMVVMRGRLSGWALVPQTVVNFFRIENGRVVEHWDVTENDLGPSSGRGRPAILMKDGT